MQWNNLDEMQVPKKQLLLYVSDQSPEREWQHFADNHNLEMLYHDELLAALGAFIMLMPGIVVIDRHSAVGDEALSHIEDVLHTTPQPLLAIIELGVPDCIARYGAVVRLGSASDISPAAILAQIDDYSRPG